VRHILIFFVILILWLLSIIKCTVPDYCSNIMLLLVILSIYSGYLMSTKIYRKNKISALLDMFVLTLLLFIFYYIFFMWMSFASNFIFQLILYFILLSFLLYKIRNHKRIFYLILYGNCSYVILLSLILYDTLKSYVSSFLYYISPDLHYIIKGLFVS
jgi:hypothetical protein